MKKQKNTIRIYITYYVWIFDAKSSQSDEFLLKLIQIFCHFAIWGASKCGLTYARRNTNLNM